MTRTMRSLIAAAALLGATPAAASADTVDGTVIARDVQRGTIVTSARTGSVATLRVARAASFRPGQRVHATATALADGTYRAAAVKRRGRPASARLRATLVRRAGGEYLLSAGSSTFAVRAGRGARVSRAGAIVAARLRVAKGKVAADKVREVGQATTIELEGRFLDAGDGTLRIAVGAQGPVTVAVPAGVEPVLEAGDDVELLVAVGADGGFTLLAVDGEIELYGAITALAPGSVSVGAVSCAVPADLDVSDLLVGDVVLLACAVSNGVLIAEELELDDLGLDEDDLPFDDDEPYVEDDEPEV